MQIPRQLWAPSHHLLYASAIGLALAGFGSYVYARKIEPGRLEITDFPLILPRLDPEFRGYRIVQISDIHMDSWMTGRLFAQIVRRVNELEPDLVAITGDFVSEEPEAVACALLEPLHTLCARDGVTAVLGNHDEWSGAEGVRKILHMAGLKDLSNRVYTIRRRGAVLHIAGVGDITESKDDIGEVLRQLPDQGAAILLAHEPDFADTSAKTGRFDLQLSGHSHGGQVRLPLLGALYLPTYGQKYPIGLYKIRDMLLYTNRGLGRVHMPFRFNCPPEITVFTLLDKE